MARSSPTGGGPTSPPPHGVSGQSPVHGAHGASVDVAGATATASGAGGGTVATPKVEVDVVDWSALRFECSVEPVVDALLRQQWRGDAAWLRALRHQFGGAWVTASGTPVLMAMVNHGEGASFMSEGSAAWSEPAVQNALQTAPATVRAAGARPVIGATVRLVWFHGSLRERVAPLVRAHMGALLQYAGGMPALVTARRVCGGATRVAVAVLGVLVGTTGSQGGGVGELEALGALTATHGDDLGDLILAPDACTRGRLPYAWNERSRLHSMRGGVLEWVACVEPWGSAVPVTPRTTCGARAAPPLAPEVPSTFTLEWTSRPSARPGRSPSACEFTEEQHQCLRMDAALVAAGVLRRLLPGTRECVGVTVQTEACSAHEEGAGSAGGLGLGGDGSPGLDDDPRPVEGACASDAVIPPAVLDAQSQSKLQPCARSPTAEQRGGIALVPAHTPGCPVPPSRAHADWHECLQSHVSSVALAVQAFTVLSQRLPDDVALGHTM